MKITKTLLAAGMTALFCCSIGKADQIVYSNNFALGTGVNISNTLPTFANTYAGGTSTARWLDTGSSSTHGVLLDNGIDTSASINYWCLPFTPQSNFVYLLTVNMTFVTNPGVAAEFGFHTLFLTNFSGDARFNGSSNGWDWMGPLYSTGNPEHFGGAKTGNAIFNASGGFPPGVGTNTFQILLDTRTVLSTTGTNWCAAGYVNGVQRGSLLSYNPNPSGILSVGISQNGTQNPTNAIQYNSFVLTTTLQPFIVVQPTAQTTLGAGSAYTNKVTVMADTNGGTLSYQWYANNLPLTNGVGNVSGADTNVLVISSVSSANQLTNYNLTVSNNYGSSTSTFASLTVLTNPVIISPSPSSHAITLFNGTGGTVGSSPTFTVTAIGAPPLSYQWVTNGVAVTGATKTSVSFTNLQSTSVTSFTCVVSNSFGTSNAVWSTTYTNAPTAAYPQLVLGGLPLEFWRLDEPDDNAGNLGVVSHDYQSGNNGVYTNVTLGQTGYNTLEPAETSLAVTAAGNQPSCVKLIGNADLAQTMTNTVNAQFSVEAWANCISGNGASGGAPVVSQGLLGSSSFFLGVDTNTTKHYQFYVRTAGGTLVSVDATNAVQANDQNWHYLAGVCDEAHSNISLYIDGSLAGSTAITTNSGNFESGMPIAIGAGIRSGAADYNVPFTGNISDVAIYPSALSIGQVISHYIAVNNNPVPVSFVAPLVSSNVAYLANQPLTISATAAGSPSLGYYWSNVTTASVLSSGTTTNTTLNASLTIPNPSTGLSGDLLELVVTNGVSSTNTFVTLFNPPPPVTLASSSQILYSNRFNGGSWSIAGMPLTAANVLVGGTNTTWVESLGTNDTDGGMQASGTPATAQASSWLLPFTPHSGYVYTLSASVSFTGNPGNWVGLGFTQIIPTNISNGAGRFADTPNTAYDWQILTESTGNVQYFAGSNGNGTVITTNGYFTAGVGSHSESIILDTTGAQWKYYSIVDAKISATNTYGSGVPSGALATNPPIGAVGFEQNGLTPGAQGFITWSNIVLTQVAPGGVPPYLLNPLPPTNVALTGGTVSIPATAFGSAPFGYYWSNNATVVASGSTNAMSPFAVNLSVPSSSLTAGQLQLVVTNAFGTNTTSITLTTTINPNPGPILYSVSGGQLTLSWPTNLGWTLQTQTNNAPTPGIGTNWVIVPNSTTTNQVTLPISQTNGSVFFRLSLP